MLAATTLAWGDVPTWIGSVGTVLAFGIAAGAYVQSQFDRRRDQAGKVTAWVSAGPAFIKAGERYEGENQLIPVFHAEIPITDRRVWIEISIRNNSDGVISDVFAWLVTYPSGSYWGGIDNRWPEIPPGLTTWAAVYKDPGVTGAAQVKLEFTDIKGIRWTRIGGQLRRSRQPSVNPNTEMPLGVREIYSPAGTT